MSVGLYVPCYRHFLETREMFRVQKQLDAQLDAQLSVNGDKPHTVIVIDR